MKGKFLVAVLFYLLFIGSYAPLSVFGTEVPRFLVSSQTTILHEVSASGETSVFYEGLPGNANAITFDAAGDLYVLINGGGVGSILKFDTSSKTIIRTYPMGDALGQGLAIRDQEAFTSTKRLDLITGEISARTNTLPPVEHLTFGPDTMLYGGRTSIFRVNPQTEATMTVSSDLSSAIKFDQRGGLYFSDVASKRVKKILPGDDGVFATFDDVTTDVINFVESSGFEIFNGVLYFSTNSQLIALNLEDQAISVLADITTWGSRVARIPAANELHGKIQIENYSYTAREGEPGLSISLVREGGSEGEVGVSFHTTEGSAKAGHDFVETNGVVSFNAGETQKNVFIPILNDAFIETRFVFGLDVGIESAEYFSFHISNATGGSSLGTQVSASIKIEDNDGEANLIWRHLDGRLAIWQMVGTNRVANFLLNDGKPVNPIWRLGTIADINQDGSADFVWQRKDGVLATWFMAGTNLVGKAVMNGGKPVAWRLLGAGDWNRDSHPDLLWRHPDGRVAIWYMNQTERVSATVLNDGKPAAWSWRFAGLADPFKTGVPSIFWQHTDGRLGSWIMAHSDQGLTRASTSLLEEAFKPSGNNWNMKGFGSFSNQPYHDGVLFQHPDGRVVIQKLEYPSHTVLLNNGKPVATKWKLIGSYGRSE